VLGGKNSWLTGTFFIAVITFSLGLMRPLVDLQCIENLLLI
jgi:hypothetical protein